MVGVFLREKGLHEGVLEGVDIPKVFEGVGVLLPKDLLADEEKDHFPDVTASVNAPFAKKGEAHGAELIEHKLSEASEKLRARDVSILAIVLFLGPVDGEVEGFLEEEVGVRVEA